MVCETLKKEAIQNARVDSAFLCISFDIFRHKIWEGGLCPWPCCCLPSLFNLVDAYGCCRSPCHFGCAVLTLRHLSWPRNLLLHRRAPHVQLIDLGRAGYLGRCSFEPGQGGMRDYMSIKPLGRLLGVDMTGLS